MHSGWILFFGKYKRTFFSYYNTKKLSPASSKEKYQLHMEFPCHFSAWKKKMSQKLIPETSLRLIYQTFSFTNSSQSSGVMAKPKYSIRGSVVSTTRLDRGFLCISQLCCLHIPSAERYTWSRVVNQLGHWMAEHEEAGPSGSADLCKTVWCGWVAAGLRGLRSPCQGLRCDHGLVRISNTYPCRYRLNRQTGINPVR